MKLAIFQSTNGTSGVKGRLEKLSKAVVQAECDLMICPELFVSGYNAGPVFYEVSTHHIGDFIAQAALQAKDTKTALVIGYPESSGDALYNSAVFIDSSGRIAANHRKLAIPPGFERDYFAAGKSATVFDYMGLKCAILICYDAEFPETMRRMAQLGVQLVIVPTALNVNWPVVADKVMPTRAFENGIWLAYANHAGSENGLDYYGHSCIVTPTGQDAARAGMAEEILSAEIDADAVKSAQARLPYIKEVTNIISVL
jgi:predicted amidohydrolase